MISAFSGRFVTTPPPQPIETRRATGKVAQDVGLDVAERLFAVFSEDVGDDAVLAKLKVFVCVDGCGKGRWVRRSAGKRSFYRPP